jgi:cell wall-associated NlpC family hydrolase
MAALLLLAVAAFSACEEDTPRSGSTAGDQAAAAAQSQVGTPYQWGGRTPGVGFDCSGLTSWSWEQAGVAIPRTSRDQYAATERIGREDLRPGDLVFYAANGSTISHVAMYVGNDTLVHGRSSVARVSEDQLSTWWTDALVGYGRVADPAA